MPTLSRRAFTQSIAAALALRKLQVAPRASLSQVAAVPTPSSPILLNYNENPYGPTPKARAALANAAEIANRYPDAAAARLQFALAKKHSVAPENILLGCGSTELLKCSADAFLPPQSNIVVSLPTFEAVLDYAKITGAAAIATKPTADYAHDLKAMAAACTSKTGIAYVCNPNNPTGTIVTRDALASFISAVPPTTLVLIDEAYFEFAASSEFATSTEFIAAHPNVVITRTFSKIYGLAGLRMGYAIGNKSTLELLSRYRVQDSLNAVGIGAALASLDDPEGLAATREKLVATRNWLCDQLKKENRPFIASHGNFVMIDVGTDTKPVIDAFAARNILVGRRFPSMPTYLRITIGTQLEVEAFVAALRQIVPSQPTSTAA
jgi:histidinol-phosphate aminotransferase